MKKLSLVCFLCLWAPALVLYAQINAPKTEETQIIDRAIIVVHTKAGEIYKGFFISQNKDFLKIETESTGFLRIPTQRIELIQSLEEYEKSIEQVLVHVNASRYILGNSAFNYKKGENYVRNNPITYHRGLTDHFSIGVGTSILTFVLGAPLLYINPLYTTEASEYVHFKIGMDAFASYTQEEIFSAAILNSGFTIGEPDLNLTGTVYYGAISGYGRLNPFYSLAGMARISEALMAVSEGFYIPIEDDTDVGFVFYGARYHVGIASYDLGFLYNKQIAEDLRIGIPFFACTIRLP